MAVTTTTALGGLFSSIYEDALFVARETNIMTALVTNYSATGWMTRNISERPQITAASVAEGVDYASPSTFGKTPKANLSPGEVIAQVVITDQDIDTDPNDVRRDASTELGAAIAAKIDSDLCSSFSSFTTDKGTGAGNAATIASFAAATAVLRNRHVQNPIYVVAHPYHWHDVFVQLGQPAANYSLLGDIANQALRDYFVGRWINVLWFTSSNITVDGSDDAISGVFSPQALAFDSRRAPRLEPERDASLRAWELNMTAGYAYGARRSTYGVKYTADATEPT